MLYDKRALYLRLENKLSELRFSYEFPLNVEKLAKREDLSIQLHPFESDAIGAVLYKDKCSAILLNSNKSLQDQRFDIAHELIHFWFHPTQTSFSFQKPHQRDKEKEWQANEGAAELLLPYRDFIPRFVHIAKYVEENYEPLEIIYTQLAHFYQVAPIVVDYRIRNLEAEILQYVQGCPIEKLTLIRTFTPFDKNRQPVIYKSFIQKINA